MSLVERLPRTLDSYGTAMRTEELSFVERLCLALGVPFIALEVYIIPFSCTGLMALLVWEMVAGGGQQNYIQSLMPIKERWPLGRGRGGGGLPL